MNYLHTYNCAFSDSEYSASHHIQYDMVIRSLLNKFNPSDQFTLIDIGSGRGHMIRMIKNIFPNCKITSVDINNYHNIADIQFIQSDLSNKEDRNNLQNNKYDVLICLDVLEHLDYSFINDVFELFHNMSNYNLFAIANHSDIFNGIELHTIQENETWWNNIINKLYYIKYFEKTTDNRLYYYELESIFNPSPV